MGDIKKVEIDLEPYYTWKDLIKQMVKNAIKQMYDTSYAKPSRKSATGATVRTATGAGAVKPGEKVQEDIDSFKIMLVLDTSTSMQGWIPKVLTETENLIKEIGNPHLQFMMTYFSYGHIYVQVNVEKDYYAVFKDDMKNCEKPPKAADIRPGWKNAFRLAGAGGTAFSDQMTADYIGLLKRKYNIIICSDSDLTWPDNLENFKKVFNADRKHVFFVAVSKGDYQKTCNAIGQHPSTFSYFK